MKKALLLLAVIFLASCTKFCYEPAHFTFTFQMEADTITVPAEPGDTIILPPKPPIPDPPTPGPRPYGQDSDLYGAIAFSDEFNNPILDESKWTPHLWYTSEHPVKNYDITDGCLNIWPILASGQFVNREFSTEGKHYQTYGYFEMEAKLPRGAGVCPTFWLYTTEAAPIYPEIDIMEAWGWPRDLGYWVAQDGTLNNYQGTVHNTSNSKQGHARLIPQIDANLSEEFHIYGAEWDETGVSFYFDGQLLEHKVMTENHFRRMFIMVWLQACQTNHVVPGSGELSLDNFYTPFGKGNSYSINYIRVWDLK